MTLSGTALNRTLFSQKSDEWATPQALFAELDAEFHFTLDPCATAENAKCDRYFTRDDDGLSQSWDGETVFVNPPYSEVAEWVKKAARSRATVVMLVPARTDTRWFHAYCQAPREVRFIKGRLKFGGSLGNAPFPSMLVVFRNA